MKKNIPIFLTILGIVLITLGIVQTNTQKKEAPKIEKTTQNRKPI